jgi:hypothetical protein
LKELISVCEAQRKIGETSLNERSSRSHQIIKLTVESSAREFLGKENSTTLMASVVCTHLLYLLLGVKVISFANHLVCTHCFLCTEFY